MIVARAISGGIRAHGGGVVNEDGIACVAEMSAARAAALVIIVV